MTLIAVINLGEKALYDVCIDDHEHNGFMAHVHLISRQRHNPKELCIGLYGPFYLNDYNKKDRLTREQMKLFNDFMNSISPIGITYNELCRREWCSKHDLEVTDNSLPIPDYNELSFNKNGTCNTIGNMCYDDTWHLAYKYMITSVDLGDELGVCDITINPEDIKNQRHPHFHLKSRNTNFESCIGLYKPEYYNHDGIDGVLFDYQTIKLYKLLEDIYENDDIIYKCKMAWNSNAAILYEEETSGYGMPDYTKLNFKEEK